MSQQDPPAPVEPKFQEPPAPKEPAPTDPPADPPNGDLGDAGKRALEAERKARRDAEKAQKTLEDRLKEYEDRDKTDLEKAQAAAQEAAARAAKAEAESLRLRIASEFGIPADLQKLLVGSNEDELRASGELLKPLVAARDGKRFEGGADGGAREGSQPPAQLTEADVKRLYAEKKYDEIEKARQEGRLVKMLGG